MTLENHSVLGGFSETYSAAERKLCLQIATQLEKRENARHPQRDDMHVYVRAAASLYELAKKCVGLNDIRVHGPRRTVIDWLRIMTGMQFHFDFPNADIKAIASVGINFIDDGGR